MAEKNIIRQDVVLVSWDVDNSELKKLSNVQKQIKSNSVSMDKEAQKGWSNMIRGANKVKSTLGPLNDKINQIGRSAIDAGKKLASAFGQAAKVAILGLGSAVVSITGLSVKAYAEFEQLKGGVETLFGAGGLSLEEYAKSVGKSTKDAKKKYDELMKSQELVLKNADKAYMTSGLSANQYMNTVTSFSASLLQSLKGDTVKAAKVADKALIDMADNANKMGTDMESIQYAYQGFSKQNYQMLDNLKLGYGGTKEEMKRLLSDASKIAGQKFDISSYADVIEAIHVIQEKMGIAGTTAKEASSTIQGSLSSMKAAWSNLLVGLADPSQDVDALLANLVKTVVTFGKNLLPRIQVILVTLKNELVPAIAKLVQDGALKVREYLIANKDTIWDGFKTMMATGINMVYQLFTGDSLNIEGLKTKIQSIADKVLEFANAVKNNWPAIKAAVIGVAIAIGTLKAVMFACNAVIAINNGLMKAKQAMDLLVAAKTKIAAAAQWAMNASMYGCPVIWLVAALVGLIAVIVLVAKNWDKVKAAAVKAWKEIKAMWAKASSWFNESVLKPVKRSFLDTWDSVCDGASTVKNNVVDAFQTAIDDVKSAWNAIPGFFSDIWKQTVKNVATPVNKLIGGANWVLEKVGSEKRLDEWKPYARGTNGHPGGNAIVNDGRGAELVQMPNGRTFIPRGRNVLMPNAPKGMKVLNAERTAHLMGRTTPTFNYSGGIGDWEIWDFFDDAKGLLNKMIDKFVSWKDMSGYPLDVGKGIVGTVKDNMVDWIKSLFNEFGGKSLASYVPSQGVEQWRSTVANALKMEGLHSEANIKRTLHQMQTESGGNPKAINNWDSNAKKGTPSKGLMQVIDPTFKAYARKGHSSNIYDPLSNILASIRYATARYGSLEKAYRGVGYATGIGNVVVPTYTPAGTATTSSTSHSNTNNYAPSFTLNMSGTVDRTTERTIKKWVREALEDMFDSMSRTSPRLTEV